MTSRGAGRGILLIGLAVAMIVIAMITWLGVGTTEEGSPTLEHAELLVEWAPVASAAPEQLTEIEARPPEKLAPEAPLVEPVD